MKSSLKSLMRSIYQFLDFRCKTRKKTKISFQLVNQCTRLWCKFTCDKEDISEHRTDVENETTEMECVVADRHHIPSYQSREESQVTSYVRTSDGS